MEYFICFQHLKNTVIHTHTLLSVLHLCLQHLAQQEQSCEHGARFLVFRQTSHTIDHIATHLRLMITSLFGDDTALHPVHRTFSTRCRRDHIFRQMFRLLYGQKIVHGIRQHFCELVQAFSHQDSVSLEQCSIS